ncbi:iron uptake transporter deferrochelatase/peroxidase subunit [Synechococcus sp. PCC 6312]|uniref:iron uptake transporter deferrochelatase/peroxidase subunit n=1 Tax=Synechococcus sp. (strain ATCC 27167 / PCC 6312) TaxID=195253 RepID=UPI00029F086E|nr:iron uptake transporter deferrochelatase/peroxidase subunit [Synechococcus sp. PCC 6312]AFY60492.1 Tat-translocated enzyme [Synechococcus sp. PCC 6312]
MSKGFTSGPLPLGRRQFLGGMVTLAGVGAMGAFSLNSAQAKTVPSDVIPFLGPHQAGIVTPNVATALVVALDVTARSTQELQKLFQILTQRIEFLTSGGTWPPLEPKYPPTGSGILGPEFSPDYLTVTVGVGASLFDDRYGLAAEKPIHLKPMPNFPNDRLDPQLCHGDLLLQLCSNHNETNIHALRDILKQLAGLVVLRWQISGFQQPDTDPHPHRTTVRNLMGFKDGTANPDPHDQNLMNRLVWVQRNSSEPAWAVGGTYQVVRVIRMFVEFWDRTALEEQEEIFGRSRDSGAPLGYKHEEDIPDYNQDPKGKTILLDAHIRLANPRTPATEANRILRKGFHYSRGVDKAGQLDMGLLFMSFQQDLERGFETVQNRLNGEPLEEYIKPTGGGYFFTLPGVPTKNSYLGQPLLMALA